MKYKQLKGMSSAAIKVEPYLHYQRGFEQGKSSAIKEEIEFLEPLADFLLKNGDFAKGSIVYTHTMISNHINELKAKLQEKK